MLKPTLKAKITLILPVATCLIMAFLLLVTHHFFVNSVKKTIATQQNFSLHIMAENIDQKLASTQQVLNELAKKITPKLISDPSLVFGFLQSQSEHYIQFDNGLFLFDKDGRMIAEYPLGLQRTGTDYSFRSYLKETFETKKPVISDPYLSSQPHHHPAIVMTIPIFDAEGSIQAVLGGSIDLFQDNFLGKLSSLKIGDTGYLFLFDTNRTMIDHPDRARIMKQDIPLGANLLLDRAIQGFDGTDETKNSRGLSTLTSFKHLQNKNWILGANYPTKEAYAPIARLQLIFVAISIPDRKSVV